MKDVALETLPKMAVLMRGRGKRMGRVSCLISDEHQTQVTPFPWSLSILLSVFPSLSSPANCEATIHTSANMLACILLYPVVIDGEGTCRQLIELPWSTGCRHLLWLRTWPVSTGRWRAWLCSSRVLAGFRNSYEATARLGKIVPALSIHI